MALFALMTDSSSFSENRRSVRLAVAVPVRLEFGHGTDLEGALNNLSQGGFFFAARPPRPVGTLLRFELSLPGRTGPIEGFGEVSWIRVRDDGASRPAGMGIRFRHLTDPGGEVLGQFLAEAATLPEGQAPGWVDGPFGEGGFSGGGFDGAEAPAPSLSVAGPWPELPGAGTVEPTFQFPLAPVERQGLGSAGEWLPPTVQLEAPAARATAWPPELAMPRGAAPAAVEPAAPRPERPSTAAFQPATPVWRRPVLWISLLIVLAGAGIYLGLRWFEGSQTEPAPRERTKRQAAERAPRQAAAPAEAAEAAPEPAALEPPPVEAPSSAASPTEAPRPSTPPVTLPPASALTDLRIESSGDGTTSIELVANGSIDASRLRHQLLSSPARLLLRVSGIEEPFSRGAVTFNTTEVSRARTGLHAEGSGKTLHVVFDLAGAAVTMERVEPTSQGLRIVFRSR